MAAMTMDRNRVKAGNNVNIINTANYFGHASTATTDLEKLHQKLQPVDNAAYDSYVSKAERCFEGTRVNLLEQIWAWIEDEGSMASIYILDGVAGIGKSTVAQTIAHQAAIAGILGASYFFTRDEEERMTIRRFVPTIAYQLAVNRSAYAARIDAALKKHPDITRKNPERQLEILVLEPLESPTSSAPEKMHTVIPSRNSPQASRKRKHLKPNPRKPSALPSPASNHPVPSPILLVVDALDECHIEEAEHLLRLLIDRCHTIPRLRVLITTRPEFNIRQVLDFDQNHERFHLHEIEDVVVQADIQHYIRSRLMSSKIQVSLSRANRSWQPSAQDMDAICRICGNLFIIASTVVTFILDPRQLNPKRQLMLLLDGIADHFNASSKRTDTMDKIYMHILLSARAQRGGDKQGEEDWISLYQTVVGTLITLQYPLPRRVLANLLEMGETDIERTLIDLHALVAPRGSDQIFRIHHKTFPDFITDEHRISKAFPNPSYGLPTSHDVTPFLIDTRAHHAKLAIHCFLIMKAKLKRNIRDLSSYDAYKDDGDVQHLLPNSICEPELAYACTQWAYHLNAGIKDRGVDADLRGYFDAWQSSQLLAWLEVLSILGKLDMADHILGTALRSIANLSESWPTSKSIMELLIDACKLVARNRDIIKVSSTHIHWSLPPFIPTNTLLYDKYQHAGNGLKLVSQGEKSWGYAVAMLQGHEGAVKDVAFSSDGSKLASASTDKTVRLWDGSTGAHIATLEGHTDHVNAVAFPSNGSRLASASNDNTVRLWDGNTGAHIATLEGHSNSVNAVAFSSDGLRLASASSDQTVRLWDGNTRTRIATLEGHSHWVSSVAFSNDGSRLASASFDNTARMWDGRTGAHIATLKGHSYSVTSVAFSSDGSRLASASDDNTVRLWDGSTGAHIVTCEGHSSYVNSVAFSSDGSRLASASNDNTVRLWNGSTGAHIVTCEGHSSYVSSVAFSSDGSRLASASNDNTVRLWNGSTGAHIATLEAHSGGVNSVAFSSDGSRLASAFNDKTVQLWDGNTGAHIATLEGHSDWVDSVALSSDGSRLASSSDNTVQLWYGSTGAQIATLKGHSDCVSSVAFSSDGSRLASASNDKTVQLWDGNTGAHIATLEGHSDWVDSVALSSDGSRLASSSDNTVQLWYGSTGAQIATLKGHSNCVSSVAFSSDGSRLASASLDGTVRLWDAITGAHIATLNGHLELVNSVAFSCDGSRLASASFDKTVRLWDGITGAHIATLEGHRRPVRSVAFSSDGSKLASSGNKIVQLWDGKTGAPLHTFTQDLTSEIYAIASASGPLPSVALCADRFFVLVQRAQPKLFGLVALSEQPDGRWQGSPFLWFPTHLDPISLAVNTNGSIAVGCWNGRVLILNISNAVFP